MRDSTMTSDRGGRAASPAASPAPSAEGGLARPLGLEGRTAGTALAVLFAAGGVLGLISLALPGWEGLNTAPLAALGFTALVVAALLGVLNAHLPVWSHQVFSASGTVIISVAVAITGVSAASATYSMLYVWVALYACLFFPWRVATGHLAFIGLASAAALLWNTDPLWGEWLIMVGTVSVSGVVVGWLVRRAQSYLRLLYEGERAVVRELEAAEQVKTDLVAVVSHELRTPLTSIRGLVRTLQVHGHRLSEEERNDFLAHVDRQSARLSRLVQNLLIASRASAADADASSRVSSVVRSAIDDVEQAGRFLSVRLIERAPHTTARIAPEVLGQVLVNLLENAAKFAPGDSEVVVVVDDEHDQVRIDVVNASDPLSEEERARMFDPFVQLAPSLEDRSEGLGLGLYVVRRLVEEHGGSVLAASDDGQLRITVRLPRARMEPSPVGPVSAVEADVDAASG